MSVFFHIALAVLIRFLLIGYGAYHDQFFVVKYTDIDYQVFTDAARYVANRDSPFNRPTYRYTPLLAYLMVPNILLSPFWGKLLFALADILTGFLIFKHVGGSIQATWCAILWWYNPLCIAVSTRGSAESLMACASVATLLFLKRRSIVPAAIVYGLSVHFKLYTVIYSLPILLSLSPKILRPSRDALVFAASSALSFLVPTLMFYHMYGMDYVREAFMYHISRKDIRHNFSPYFYLLYLTDQWPNSWALAWLMFVPQVAVLGLLGLRLGTKEDLALCVFSQTFVFVMFNKVCTSQYFLWFLCLLPLLLPKLGLTRGQWIAVASEWFFGQSLWLLSAYLLEFRGLNTFLYIWISGLLFLFINIHVLKQILSSYKQFRTKIK